MSLSIVTVARAADAHHRHGLAVPEQQTFRVSGKHERIHLLAEAGAEPRSGARLRLSTTSLHRRIDRAQPVGDDILERFPDLVVPRSSAQRIVS